MTPTKTVKRRIWRWVLGSAVLLLVVIGFLPTIIGARWVYQPLIDQLAADDFRLSIDRVQLRWLSPLRLDGLKLSETDGASLVTVRQVKTERSLLGYLFAGRQLGRLEVIEPTVSVELLKDGSTVDRIIHALDRAGSQPGDAHRKLPPVDIEVVIEQLSVKVMRQDVSDPLVVIPPLNLQLMYRAASGNSHLTIKPTRVLDQVKITQELIDLGLGHAVPLLAKSAWFDGSVSLEIGEIDVPLLNPELAQGSLELTLHEVRSGPNDPDINRLLDFLALIRQREPVHELVFVDDSIVQVTLSDQRVHHEGLRFGLPKLDSRLQIATRGSVGIQDKSLDLVIAVPVPVEQVARREKVQELGVPTLSLPITGTLDTPHVDWDALRGDAAQLLGAIRDSVADDAPATASVVGVIEGLAEGKADESIAAAVDLIGELRKRRQAKVQAAEQAAPSAAESEPPSAETPRRNQPLRGGIRDLLKRK